MSSHVHKVAGEGPVYKVFSCQCQIMSTAVRATVLIKKQMSAAQDQFDKLVERLKLEHQSRLKEPKAELEAIKLLTEKEHRRLVGSWSLAPQPQNPQLPSAGQDIMRPRPVVKLAS